MPQQNKPKISISGFDVGMVENENLNVPNACQLMQELEAFTRKGTLQATDLVSAGGSTTSLVTSMCMFNDGSGNGNEPYAIAGTKIYRYRSSAWSVAHTNGQTCTAGSIQFIKPYSNSVSANTKKALYYTADAVLGEYYYDGAAEQWDDTHSSSAFDNDDTKAHPMVEHAGYLYIGDGNKVARLEPNGASWDADALVLPPEWRVMCMKVYNDRIIIGCWKGTNIYDTAEAKLFVWDGVTGNEEEMAIALGETGIHAMEVYQNYLFVFAGVKGNIYIFNGATLSLFKTIPNVVRRVHVKAGAVSEFRGKLLFGFSDDDAYASETARQGVWAIGRKTPGDPFSLSLEHLEDTGTTIQNQIGAIMPNADGSGIFFSRYNATDYKINGTSAWGASKESGGEFHSQKYTWAIGSNGEPITGVEIFAKPIPSGCSIRVDTKINDETSWITGPTFTSSNQHLVQDLRRNSLAKIIQIRLVYTTSGGNTPQLWQVLLY